MDVRSGRNWRESRGILVLLHGLWFEPLDVALENLDKFGGPESHTGRIKSMQIAGLLLLLS